MSSVPRALLELMDHTTSGARDAAPGLHMQRTRRRATRSSTMASQNDEKSRARAKSPPSRGKPVERRQVRCSRCELPACFEQFGASLTVCLRHLYVCTGEAPGNRWRLVSREAMDAQRLAVEEAWQQSYDAVAQHLSAAAADELTKVETSDDPLASLIEAPKHALANAPQDPRKRRKGPAVPHPEAQTCKRKPTKPSMLWATSKTSHQRKEDEAREHHPEPAIYAKGAPCLACGSTDTVLESRGGGNVHAHKVEIWGSKDAPDAVYRTTCQHCTYSWDHTD